MQTHNRIYLGSFLSYDSERRKGHSQQSLSIGQRSHFLILQIDLPDSKKQKRTNKVKPISNPTNYCWIQSNTYKEYGVEDQDQFQKEEAIDHV